MFLLLLDLNPNIMLQHFMPVHTGIAQILFTTTVTTLIYLLTHTSCAQHFLLPTTLHNTSQTLMHNSCAQPIYPPAHNTQHFTTFTHRSCAQHTSPTPAHNTQPQSNLGSLLKNPKNHEQSCKIYSGER